MISTEARAILEERFGHDSLISLATVDGEGAAVRHVNALLLGDAFYSITWAGSGKIEQLAKNPSCGICGDWFTARGLGENLGWVGKAENRLVMEKLRTAFAGWYGNGHVDESDRDTVLLRIRLVSGVLMNHGIRYDLEF